MMAGPHYERDPLAAEVAGSELQLQCHGASLAAGWWTEDALQQLRQGTPIGLALFGLKLALVHSELSEALEGARKDKADEHLPHRKSVEVELADAGIRIADLAGAMGLDLGAAIAEKMAYNAQRADHKPEARAAEGGKRF